MAKLTKMDRDDIQSLLEKHSTLCAIENKIGRRGISAGITTSNSYDASDYESVTIDNVFAKRVIAQQREKVEKALGGYGLTVK